MTEWTITPPPPRVFNFGAKVELSYLLYAPSALTLRKELPVPAN
jgi:hypothetical protein